ncbi:MAG TPA: PemK-like protein [Planctomycetales bacterium]|jgi:hypothetical protein|nr:PemK-like protein [Planctomycetales bacterium]
MNPGEIHLTSFPFGGKVVGAKTRPALLLTGPLGTFPEVLAAYITTVFPLVLLPTDIVLDPRRPDHRGIGLKKRSLLRLHRLVTVHQASLLRYLGKVSAVTQSDVEKKLRLLLKL